MVVLHVRALRIGACAQLERSVCACASESHRRYAAAGVAVLVFILAVILLRDTIMACRVSAVPGPSALPFVGHIPYLLSEPWNRFGEWARKYGDIYKM